MMLMSGGNVGKVHIGPFKLNRSLLFFLLGLPVQSWPVWLAAVHHELRLLDPIFSLHHRGLKKSNPRVGSEATRFSSSDDRGQVG